MVEADDSSSHDRRASGRDGLSSRHRNRPRCRNMGFVTVNGRTEYSEPVQIVLGPVFDVESNGDLENGRSLRRFCAMRIDNLSVPGGIR